jgi:hypothetical protein
MFKHKILQLICYDADSLFSYGGGLEYLHRSPASRRRRKGNPVPGGYNWATLSLGDINMGTWFSGLGVGRKGEDIAKTNYCCEVQRNKNHIT